MYVAHHTRFWWHSSQECQEKKSKKKRKKTGPLTTSVDSAKLACPVASPWSCASFTDFSSTPQSWHLYTPTGRSRGSSHAPGHVPPARVANRADSSPTPHPVPFPHMHPLTSMMAWWREPRLSGTCPCGSGRHQGAGWTSWECAGRSQSLRMSISRRLDSYSPAACPTRTHHYPRSCFVTHACSLRLPLQTVQVATKRHNNLSPRGHRSRTPLDGFVVSPAALPEPDAMSGVLSMGDCIISARDWVV